MKHDSKPRDPAKRLDEIIAEIGRLYAEADRIVDHELQPVWAPQKAVLN
jgi:hypothetical protein